MRLSRKMKEIIFGVILTHLIIASVNGYEDVNRFFTNGHGGYQFFHADENQYQPQNNRRMDTDISYSDSIKVVLKPPEKSNQIVQPIENEEMDLIEEPISASFDLTTQPSELPVTIVVASVSTPSTTPPPQTPFKLNRHKLVPRLKFPSAINNKPLRSNTISNAEENDISSADNHIFKAATTSKPRTRFTTARKRIVVRKFMPKTPSPVEKNKKREISAATSSNGLHAARDKIPRKHKFTNRNFKPRQVEKMPAKNNAVTVNRGALFTRKPNDKFVQLHFRKLEVTTTTTTTASPMQSMKEKRHLANIRFFSRRKLRT